MRSRVQSMSLSYLLRSYSILSNIFISFHSTSLDTLHPQPPNIDAIHSSTTSSLDTKIHCVPGFSFKYSINPNPIFIKRDHDFINRSTNVPPEPEVPHAI